MADDMKNLGVEIDRLLYERRPDRYVVRGEANGDDSTPNEDVPVEQVGDTWLDDIAGEIAGLVPESEAQRRLARTLIGQREGRATRRGNKIMREIYETGQRPLPGMFDLGYPIAVITRRQQPGESESKIIEERVAQRALAPEDYEAFSVEERRRAGVDFATRNHTCVAAEWLAQQIRAARAVDTRQWIEDPPEGTA